MMQEPRASSYLDLIRLAKQEDLGGADVTSEVTVAAEQSGGGQLVFCQEGILCGMGVVEQVLAEYDKRLRLVEALGDGAMVKAGEAVGGLTGPLRSLLAAERVMLNFLQRLSGIATTTARYVEAVKGTNAKICDTRKTTPGWRELEKYAVRCGGGVNHRQGLYDAVLIKDNHLAALGAGNLQEALEQAIAKVQQRAEAVGFVEVEVDSLEQLSKVLGIKGVDMVLLDNMAVDELREAVQMRDRGANKVLLEASGKVRLANVAQIAGTGVDRISVGALTHSVESLDIGFDLKRD